MLVIFPLHCPSVALAGSNSAGFENAGAGTCAVNTEEGVDRTQTTASASSLSACQDKCLELERKKGTAYANQDCVAVSFLLNPRVTRGVRCRNYFSTGAATVSGSGQYVAYTCYRLNRQNQDSGACSSFVGLCLAILCFLFVATLCPMSSFFVHIHTRTGPFNHYCWYQHRVLFIRRHCPSCVVSFSALSPRRRDSHLPCRRCSAIDAHIFHCACVCALLPQR